LVRLADETLVFGRFLQTRTRAIHRALLAASGKGNTLHEARTHFVSRFRCERSLRDLLTAARYELALAGLQDIATAAEVGND